MHCHLLPGIDDGAKDSEETMKMLQIAYDEGIRAIFATPHFHPRRGHADVETVLEKFTETYRRIKQSYPDMKLYEGNEIYFSQDVVQMLKAGQLLTLANSDYVLIEFSTMAESVYIRDAVNAILMAGYFPVIAHVERYESLIENIRLINELVNSGVYIQVNAGSVIGDAGGRIKRVLRKLIHDELVHFIGTDAHSSKARAPHMEKCARYLLKKFGEETADRLLYDNPMQVVQNKII